MEVKPIFEPRAPNVYEQIKREGSFSLNPITVNEDYLRKRNESCSDFVLVCIDNRPVRDSLYRVGGIGGKFTDGYIMLLKYVESVYEMDFLKRCYPDKSNKELKLQENHLAGHWCILDKFGNEKVVFDRYSNPYMTGGCVYSND